MSSKSQAKALRPDTPYIYGIDEVGRGPLAGPVITACVHIPAHARGFSFWQHVTDSKKLSAKKREMLFEEITACCPYALGEASPREIDDLNIHHATLLGMKRAYLDCHSLANAPKNNIKALIDGKFCPDLPCSAQAVIKGDSKHLEIAAASIIAKVTRDRLMADLHKEHPHYGWATNAGYGTAEHLEGIRLHGITEHHRQSFAPCAQYALAV